MKDFEIPLLFLVTFFLFMSSCKERDFDLPPLPGGVQAVSLLGDTLETQELSQELYNEQNPKLVDAVAAYRDDPDDAQNIIWLGRRTAYVGEFREAVRMFTEGIYKFPEDPRMYRHRGHRYITLRLFEPAIKDFEYAKAMMEGKEDRVEPDGLSNEESQPQSTLKANVYYHKGLAHYLKGEFEEAITEYENALQLDLTDDMRIAILYWYYMSLKRSGNDLKAGEIIEPVNAEVELIENEAYLNLLLVFKGVFDTDRLMEVSDDALENATLGYGIGNWHYINGREDRAISIWENIYQTDEWPAFGYIASEAELARFAGES